MLIIFFVLKKKAFMKKGTVLWNSFLTLTVDLHVWFVHFLL